MSSAETISVTMTSEMLRAVHESIASGEYASPSAVMQEAVQLWQRLRLDDAERMNGIRARIRRSLDDPRPPLSSEEVRASLEPLFAQARQDVDGA